MTTETDGERSLVLGRVSGAFGVRGWLKIVSETDPPEAILRYSPWYLADAAHAVLGGRRHGRGLIAQLAGCTDRDRAAALSGAEIRIRRAQLPPSGPDEIYWADLEGLQVMTLAGVELGHVSHLLRTVANDILVVRGERERLLPFVWGAVVQTLDPARRELAVDWDPEF